MYICIYIYSYVHSHTYINTDTMRVGIEKMKSKKERKLGRLPWQRQTRINIGQLYINIHTHMYQYHTNLTTYIYKFMFTVIVCNPTQCNN